MVPQELGQVAFTAHAFDATYSTIGETITFNVTSLNVGDAFDNSTGSFTCPRTGYYAFHATFLSASGSFFTAHLYVGDVYVITVRSEVTDPVQSANMAVVLCESGEVVRLVTGDDGIMQLRGEDDELTSSFTGFLISTDFSLKKNFHQTTHFS